MTTTGYFPHLQAVFANKPFTLTVINDNHELNDLAPFPRASRTDEIIQCTSAFTGLDDYVQEFCIHHLLWLRENEIPLDSKIDAPTEADKFACQQIIEKYGMGAMVHVFHGLITGWTQSTDHKESRLKNIAHFLENK